MRKLLVLAAAWPVCCFASADPSGCTYDYIQDIWRIQITTTDANPPAQIGAAIAHNGSTYFGQVAVIVSGQLLPGIIESRHVSIDMMQLYPSGYSEYSCTFGIKTVSLLERNGIPFGKRITRYLLIISPSGYQYDDQTGISTTTSTVSGKIRYDTYDASDTFTGSINATFTGASISGIVFAYDGDPLWTTPQ